MITQIRRFLGVDTDEEKLSRFRELEKSLAEVNKRIDVLAEDFSERYREKDLVLKSDQPEFVKDKVTEKFEEFLKSQKELVIEVKKEKESINKGMEPLLKIESISNLVENERNYSIVKSSYKLGMIGSDVFDKFYKAKQGKVLYADNLVFNEEGKMLLLKRSKTDKTQPDVWVIPGGHIDLGEEFEDAAKRELQEESGLNADQVTLVGDYSNDEVEIRYYRSTVNSQEQPIILQESEMQDYCWIDPYSELNNYEFPFNMKDNIKRILNIEDTPNVVIIKAFKDGIIDKGKFLEIMKSKSHKYTKKTPDGKGGFNYEYPEDKKGKSKEVELEELEAKKTVLLKQVEPLAQLKKKLYSKVDIESPKSEEEKKLDKKIIDLFSEINSIVHEKRKIKKEIEEKKSEEKEGNEIKNLYINGAKDINNGKESNQNDELGMGSLPTTIISESITGVGDQDNPKQKVDRQLSNLRGRAEAEGFLRESLNELRAKSFSVLKGTEAEVLFQKNGSGGINVLKAFDPTSHLAPTESIDDFVTRIDLYNQYFPETSLEFKGVSDGDKGITLLFSQPFIDGDTLKTKIKDKPAFESFQEAKIRLKDEDKVYKQIAGELKKRHKFTPKYNLPTSYSNGEINISDVHFGNVMQGVDGKLYFIDMNIEPIKTIEKSENIFENFLLKCQE
jgi:8-oxo-dGTP diphosphatase